MTPTTRPPTGSALDTSDRDPRVGRPVLTRTPTHAVVVCSGGLDSTVLAYWLAHLGARLSIVSVDYGQRHRVELQYARGTAARLGVPFHLIDLSGVGRLLAGSALTDSTIDVPDGHYTDASMRATVVPNRNALLLDVAVAVATTRAADAVVFGAHAGDHAIYPDCRPAFLHAYRRAVALATDGLSPTGIAVEAPFLTMAKTQIVALGSWLDVSYTGTWSCYRGLDRHCGTCGTCVERREAFADAGICDPTLYAAATAGRR